ncbi:histone-lysine N-methyltransferase EHMT1-like isoform X2 [Halichondria panicea]|uniref:histone-lysine N-methyltransferase EHMT1-like isoform X2 n=1 Tax=Halichondria panicea TaxID=6063 RepID=UPI00312B30C8
MEQHRDAEHLKEDVKLQSQKLDKAARNGNVSEVKSLLARGVNPNHPGCSPLHSACKIGHMEMVKALVEAGADTELAMDRYPVHWAALRGHKEVLVYLIRDCKCNANTRDNDDDTLLHMACLGGHLDVVQYLVEEAHCDITCIRGHQGVVQYLVGKTNCDINVRNNKNDTPLHYACSGGHQNMVQYLVEEAHCDINVRNNENDTPLHNACLGGHQGVVQYLVEKANCDINATNKCDETPLGIAELRDYKYIVDYLKTRQESFPGQPDEGSLSSERLQYSADPVQRSTISSSAGGDSQVHTQRGSTCRKRKNTEFIVKTPSPEESRKRRKCTASASDKVITTQRVPPANRVALQELMRRYNLTDEQVNSEIVDSDIPEMALCFDDVDMYSTAMGLAIAEQADVKESRGNQAAMMKCLKIWKGHNPSRATYRALLGIALRLGKGNTADQVCQQLTQHRTLD